ncbi:ORF6N domain-containing protein [Bacillus sp. 1P02SD]|uniref:ORF6N domain-containing protein n=1 Tax=Bacillus sp. 1P02SD TaxID=3132264 RepID=UPI0039A388BE
MNIPAIIEQNGMRVLTTAQLAEAYGSHTKVVNRNFQRNSERYIQGKHFFALTGEELKEFKGSRQFDDTLKFASVLYLWTEKGAWLHAKSLNTDQAWNAYELLVDDYYSIKQAQLDTTQLSPELQMFNKMFTALAQNELEQKRLSKEVAETKQEVQNIRDIVALNTRDWRKDVNSILNDIARKHGGYEQYRFIRNESYQLLEQRASANLNIRVTNKQKKMALEGAPKSKIDKVSKLDAIDDDKRLLEIYLAVIKELAIKYQVEIQLIS